MKRCSILAGSQNVLCPSSDGQNLSLVSSLDSLESIRHVCGEEHASTAAPAAAAFPGVKPIGRRTLPANNNP